MDHTSPFTLDNLQRVAPQVLSQLRAMGDFPEHGTVAGQAVASLFWKALDLPFQGPVNDIDVFVNMNMPRSLRGGDDDITQEEHRRKIYRRSTKTTTHMKIGCEARAYGQMARIALRGNLQILSTYRAGLVNYTLVSGPLVSRDKLGHETLVSQALVDGFDLNLVSVGINLDSGQVVASPGFLAFLGHGQIQAQTCNTPAHTLIRLANKVFGGQLNGVQCDFEQERQLLESAIACQGVRRKSYSSDTLLQFGERYHEQYQRQVEHLPALVTLPSVDETSPPLYQLRPDDRALDNAHILAQVTALDDKEAVVHLATMNHFPALWRALHQEGPQGTTAQALHRLMDATDTPRAVIALADALGHHIPEVNVGGMDNTERVAFFFNQQCSKTRAAAQEAAQAWENLDPLEQCVLARCQIQADDVLALGRDQRHWRVLLGLHGEALLRTLGQATPLDGDFSGHHAVLDTWLGHLETMGNKGRAVVQAVMPLDAGDADFVQSLMTFNDLMKSMDHNAQVKMACGTRLMALAFPGWPQPERMDGRAINGKTAQEAQHEDKTRFSGALRYAAQGELDVDAQWLASLTPVEARAGILAVAKGGKDPGCAKMRGTVALFEGLLSHLDVRDLRRKREQLGRATIAGGGGEALANWLKDKGHEGQRYSTLMLLILDRVEQGIVDTVGRESGDSWANGWNAQLAMAQAALRRQSMQDIAQATRAGLSERKPPRI